MNNNSDPKKLSPCCICKETKTKRDDCIRFNSEEKCQLEIQSHLDCLSTYNLKVKTDK